MAKQTLKDLRVIAKVHKIKGYYKLCKANFVEILRDMGEEIPDDEPAPKKKCPHVKVKYTCNYCGVWEGMEYVNTTSRSRIVKSAETRKYVNTTSRRRVVKSVSVSIF